MNIPRAIGIQTTDVSTHFWWLFFSNRKGELTIVLEFNSKNWCAHPKKSETGVLSRKVRWNKGRPSQERDGIIIQRIDDWEQFWLIWSCNDWDWQPETAWLYRNRTGIDSSEVHGPQLLLLNPCFQSHRRLKISGNVGITYYYPPVN